MNSEIVGVSFLNSSIKVQNSITKLALMSNSIVKVQKSNFINTKIFKSVILAENSSLSGTFIDSLICDKDSELDPNNIMIDSKIESYTSTECEKIFQNFEEEWKEEEELRERK